ncbi:unnamed protein product [Boreogadus saida]
MVEPNAVTPCGARSHPPEHQQLQVRPDGQGSVQTGTKQYSRFNLQKQYSRSKLQKHYSLFKLQKHYSRRAAGATGASGPGDTRAGGHGGQPSPSKRGYRGQRATIAGGQWAARAGGHRGRGPSGPEVTRARSYQGPASRWPGTGAIRQTYLDRFFHNRTLQFYAVIY